MADAGKVLGVVRKILGVLTDSKLVKGPIGKVLDWGRSVGLWQRGQGPGDFGKGPGSGNFPR